MTFQELINETRAGRPLALLVGSGTSFSAGIPTAQQLLDRFTSELQALGHKDDPKSYSEAISARFPSRQERRAFFERVCAGKQPQPEHYAIAQLVRRGFVRAIISTNFDHLIEQGLLTLPGLSIPTVLHRTHLPQRVLPGVAPVLAKIHGDFLFDDIANVPKELADRTSETERQVLRDLTRGCNLLVVGYSGSDANVMATLGELVANRSASDTRVWWSEFRRDALVSPSLFRDLLENADRQGNSVVRVGPWTAEECLAQLASKLGCVPDGTRPFGLGDCELSFSSFFEVPSFQRLAGSPMARREALVAHADLAARVLTQNGVTLLCYAGDIGVSVLLSAISEAQGRGFYFDSKFAAEPPHVALIGQLRAYTAIHSRSPHLPSEAGAFLETGAVLAIDHLERSLDDAGAQFAPEFLRLVSYLAQTQQELGTGAICVSVPLSPDELMRGAEAWPELAELLAFARIEFLSGAHRIAGAPGPPAQDLLAVLSLCERAVPVGAALRAAVATEADMQAPRLPEYVDVRLDRAIVRPRHRRRFESGVTSEQRIALAERLSNELREAAKETSPGEAAGRILQAEALLWNAGRKIEAIGLFLSIANLDALDLLEFSAGTLLDYARDVTRNREYWRDLPTALWVVFLRALVRVARRCEASGDQGRSAMCYEAVRYLLATSQEDRSAAERTFMRCGVELELPLDRALVSPQEAKTLEALETGLASLTKADRALRVTAFHRRQRLSQLARAYRAVARSGTASTNTERADHERMLGEVCLLLSGAIGDLMEPEHLGRRTRVAAIMRRANRWAVRAEGHAVRAKNKTLLALARENQAPWALNFNEPPVAEEFLKRLCEEAAEEDGFTYRKAVSYGNRALFCLKHERYGEAEAFFFEANLQNLALGRLSGVVTNLDALLECCRRRPKAVASGTLPTVESVEHQLRQLLVASG